MENIKNDIAILTRMKETQENYIIKLSGKIDILETKIHAGEDFSKEKIDNIKRREFAQRKRNCINLQLKHWERELLTGAKIARKQVGADLELAKIKAKTERIKANNNRDLKVYKAFKDLAFEKLGKDEALKILNEAVEVAGNE